MEITMLKYFCKSENRTEIEHLKKKINAIKEKLFSFVVFCFFEFVAYI